MQIFSLLILLLLSACSWSDYKLMVPDEVAMQQEQDRQSREDAIISDEVDLDARSLRARQPIPLEIKPVREYAPGQAAIGSSATIDNRLYVEPAQKMQYKPQLPPSSGIKINKNVEVFPVDEWTLPPRFRK